MKTTIALLTIVMNIPALAAWTPPENPDAHKILNEARSDTKAARYEDALAKYVWFHENALKINPDLRGVRISFALSDWAELGAAYPPALEKLKFFRDSAYYRVRQSDQAREAFNDFAGINRYLNESDKTKELFLWLDSHNPELAKRVFDLAEPVLIDSKEYSLWGRYVQPDSSFGRILFQYRETKRVAPYGLRAPQLLARGETNFVNQTTTLVALLVLNDRKADAERIAAEALKERNDAAFKAELEKAKQGSVPAPWP